MKMKPEHYAQLEQAIQRVQSEYPLCTAEQYAKRGYSGKRYRWGALATATRKGYFKFGDGVGMSGCPLYAYLNDDHIDTALRRITGTK